MHKAKEYVKIDMTPKQRIENYWYHYKWPTIITVFFIITGIICLVQCSAKEKPDAKALMYLNQNQTQAASNELSNILATYIPDRNENGEILYRVDDVSFNLDSIGNVNYTSANSQKLFAAVSSSDYLLYIVDEHGFEYLMSGGMELFDTYDFLPDKDGMAWNWNGSQLQQKMDGYGLPDNLYFCLRIVDGTTIEKNSGVKENLDCAVTMLKEIISEG